MRLFTRVAIGWRPVAIVAAGVAAIVTSWQVAQAGKLVLASTLVETLEGRIDRAVVTDWSTVTGTGQLRIRLPSNASAADANCCLAVAS